MKQETPGTNDDCVDENNLVAMLLDPTLPIHMAYGGLSFFISSLNNIFIIFYMSTFINIFKIDSRSFYIGESLFFIWNSINDPLFGWISDKNAVGNSPDTTKNIILKRVCSLSKYGPLFAVSYLLFWFELLPVSIQFSLALCLYDSFLTMVDLQHQSLLADIVIDSNDRVKLNTYCSIFNAIGTTTLFIAFKLWNKQNLFSFQLFIITLVISTIIGFQLCCYSMKQYYNTRIDALQKQQQQQQQRITETSHTSTLKIESCSTTFKKYIHQLWQHRNFQLFSIMNLIQIFHCHFNSNFFPFILQELLGERITLQSGALLLVVSFLLPYLNNIYLLQLCKKYGSYHVIKILLLMKLSLGCIMWTIGTNYWLILCLFLTSNRVFTEGICKLLNLVITDLVDEDYVKFKRRSPVSALIFGTAALFSKPGQTLAPLLGSYLIFLNTGKSIFINEGKKMYESGEMSGSMSQKEGFFRVVVFLPVFCAIIQLIAWNYFDLHGEYLQNIKKERLKAETTRLNEDV